MSTIIPVRPEPFDPPPVRPFEARPFALSLSKGGRAPQDRPESVEGRRHPQDRHVGWRGRDQQAVTLREPQGDRHRRFIAQFLPIFLLCLLLIHNISIAASPIEERVVEHHLKNGLTLLVMERHQAPIVAVNLTYKVGSVNEHVGITGVAHLYEHMAFKGSRTIGVTDAEKERPLLEEMDRLSEAMAAEIAKGESADKTKLASLREQLIKVDEQAQQYVVPSELASLYQRNGGVGLNATTGKDLTRYFLSLPANRLPLWAVIESNRMNDAVLREFYKEKQVVLEERRMRTDNSPSGRLYEAFSSAAYWAHPYGLPVIGWPSDLENLSREATQAFFQTYYGPGNAIIAVVGDVNSKEVITLIEETFGRIAARPPSPPVLTTEPPADGERRVEVEYEAEPAILIGFHKPATSHPDDDVFDVIESLLSDGRTSRLYRRLVQERQIAAGISAFSDFPGARYPNLFVISGIPRAPHAAAELEQAVYEELERLKREPVGARELEKILNQLDAAEIRGLRSNSGMASRLAYYQAITGDWRDIVRKRDRVAKITPDDIRRVAAKYFVKSNRIVTTLIKPSVASQPKTGISVKPGSETTRPPPPLQEPAP
jgi:predicted Zn-dependent peptidase